MRTLSKISLSLLLSLSVGQGFADSFEGSLEQKLSVQRSLFPQEKIHVMTDRELYQPGDTLWLRAWVLDGETLTTRIRGSRFIYAELRDNLDSLRKCVKIKEAEGRFAGQMVIPKKLNSGNYTLVAYTYYALGTHEDFIFKKTIHLISAKDVQKGYTARPLYEGYKPEAPDLKADADRPYSYYRHDTLMRVTFEVPDSTWLSISVTDDNLTPVDPNVSIAKMLPRVPDLFTLDDVAKDTVFYKPRYSFERTQSISGHVLDNPKNMVNTIKLANITDPSIQKTQTDGNGKFTFHNIDYPDSTLFAVMGYTPGGKQVANIVLSNYQLPKTIHHLPSNAKQYYVNVVREGTNNLKTESTDDSPLANLKDETLTNTTRGGGFELQDLMAKVIEYEASTDKDSLDKIIKDNEIKEILQAKEMDDIYTRLADETKFADNLSEYRYHTVKSMVERFDGVYFDVDVAMYKEDGYEASPVRFVVNKKEVPIEVEQGGLYKSQSPLDYPIELVYAADFINPDKATALGDTDYPDSPIIRLDLRRKDELILIAHVNRYLNLQMPLGYSKRLFFNNFKVVHQPRSTRYWNPELFTGGSGKVTLTLPLPNDYHTTYTLRAEGVTPKGEPVSIIYRIIK